MKIRAVTLLICLTISHFAASQTRFAFEQSAYQMDTSRTSGDLLLRVLSENFFKNNEYSNDFIEGYTLPGYRLRPTLILHPTSDVALEAGVELLQYHGDDNFDVVKPYVSAQWRINPTWTLRMGNLDGAMSHDLHDAIFDDERQLTQRAETGAQITAKSRAACGEVWINWHQFIRSGDTIPERFMAGISATFTPEVGQNLRLRVPLRLTASHIGGQISDYPMPVQTHTNGSLAVELEAEIGHNFVRRVGGKLQGLFFATLNGSGVYPFKNGAAFCPKIDVETKVFEASVEYFCSRHFMALHGNPMYSCISARRDDFSVSRRSLLSAEMNINHAIARNVRFSLGGKLHWDTLGHTFDYLYAFYLTLSPTIKLSKLKL